MILFDSNNWRHSLFPGTYRKATHTTERPLAAQIRLADKSHRRYLLVGGEEMDVAGRTVEVGEGRCGDIWPEQTPVSRQEILKSQRLKISKISPQQSLAPH